MKRNLGSFLFLILLLPIVVHASTYSWSSFSSKEKLYVGESVHLKYICKFNDQAELYIIEFKPNSNDIYDVVLLRSDSRIKNGKRINTYEYILKPKVAQKLELDFEATVKKTSLDSINDSTTNHYDDTKFDSIHEEIIVKMDKITLDVLSSPKKLVGKFELQLKKDELHVKAYEPYHLDIKISGQGNFDLIENITYDIKGVKVFTQNLMKNVKLDKDGYKGSITQQFAFVSAKDFTIPTRTIEYFNNNLQKIQTLEIEAIDVKVNKAYKKSELLDEVEEDIFSRTFAEKIEYLYYLLVLMSGFLVGKINFKTKSLSVNDDKLLSKIKGAKSLEQLSILLVLDDERKYRDILHLIDTKTLTSLAKAKKILIRALNEK